MQIIKTSAPRVIGLDTAAREAWYQRSVEAAAKPSRRDLPINVTYCRHCLDTDVATSAYTCITFNNNGSLLLVGTSKGLILFIGLQTLSCYYQLDTKEQAAPEADNYDAGHSDDFKSHKNETSSNNYDDISNESYIKIQPPGTSPKIISPLTPWTTENQHQSSPSLQSIHCQHRHSSIASTRVEQLEFFDFDCKLSCMASNHLIIYELIPRVREIIRIDLELVFGAISSTLLVYSEKQTVTPVKAENAFSPSQFYPSTSQQDSHLLTTSSGSLRKSSLPPKSSTFHSIASFCKILALSFIQNNKSQLAEVDFLVSFSVNPHIPTIRITFDTLKTQVISTAFIISQDQLGTKLSLHSSIRDVLLPIVVFTKRYKTWTFQLDRSTGMPDNIEESPLSCSSQKTVREQIRNHNSCIRLSESFGTTNFSFWGADEKDATRVYCCVGVARGVVLLELFPSISVPTQVLAWVEFSSSLNISAELIVNRSGSLLVSRSSDRVTLVEIIEDDVQYNEQTEFDTGDHPTFRNSKFALKIRFSYCDIVQRERFDCATFCDGPLNEEIFLVCSSGFAPSVHFFGTIGNSGAQSLLQKIDVAKAGGLKQIVWRPGSVTWAALSAKDVCVLLFTPPPIKHIWAVMAPDFEYLEKNREIIETEEEFDDLIWLDKQKQLSTNTIAASYSRNTEINYKQMKHQEGPSENGFDNVFVWYTSVVTDTTFQSYPFFCLDKHTSCAQKEEVQESSTLWNQAQPSDIHDNNRDVLESILRSRCERKRPNLQAAEGGEDTSCDTSTDLFVWLTDNTKIKERYRNMIRRHGIAT